MIGYISGKLISSEDNTLLVDVSGVGYSVLVSSHLATSLRLGAVVELYIYTNLRENALELFGFSNPWEKRVFLLLTSVSGVGPRTALSILSGVEPNIILSAIVRDDKLSLTRVPGVGKKTAERLIVELSEKARKLLAERPSAQSANAGSQSAGISSKSASHDSIIPPQGASASASAQSLDVTDLWNEALAALVNLGYRDAEAIAAIKVASNRASESGLVLSLEQLIRGSLQLMTKGIAR
ncbi:MAG: Holliday junction branch migration protein RuvA [Bdellovibrionota bacterium]